MHVDDADEDTTGLGVFDIYETQEGPRTVGNPVRRQILARMAGRELTVPEMIAATGLTKSTLSTHLAILHKERYVAYREDPEDRRKKRYYLISRRICCGRPNPQGARLVDGPDALTVAGGVPKMLLRRLVAELSGAGLDLRPLLRETGRRVGEMAMRDTAGADPDTWAERATDFWTDNGLGRLEVLGTEEGAVAIVRECRLCCEAPGATHMMCTLAAGLIEGMASEAFQSTVDVREMPPAEGDREGCGCRFHVTDLVTLQAARR